jgi:excisionase family DNA binding protein
MSNAQTDRRDLSSTTSTPDHDVMTLEEAAAFLRCDPATVKRRAKVLSLPHKRRGSLWRFWKPDLVAWMQDKAA